MGDPGPDEPDLSFLAELPLTRAATAYASDRHANQRRDADGALFLLHPLEVASLLERSHYPDYVVAAAVLHDVLEDTCAERSELEALFGSEVADLVALVSDDPSIDDEEERKDDVRERVRQAGGYGPVVYAADKVSKLRELRTEMTLGLPPEQAERKLRRHRKSLEMLEQTMPGSRLLELVRFELEALERMPPAP